MKILVPFDRMGYLYRKRLMPEVLKNATENIPVLRDKILDRVKVFPTMENYWDAASGITLLQEAYQVGENPSTIFDSAHSDFSYQFQLNTTQLAYGKVQVEAEAEPDGGGAANAEFVSAHEPSLREILELGTAACNRGWWDTGIKWYEVGVAKYQRGDEATATEKEFT